MDTRSLGFVLLLDDDPGILTLERRGMERAGYEVTAVATPEAARAAALTRRPDVLVFDYRLSGAVTGLDVFRDLRGVGLDVPAILVTGFSDETRVIEALRAGVRDVVPKAGDYLEYLPEAVGRVMAQVRAGQKAAEAEALRESRRYYRTLAEALPQLVWTCTAEGAWDYLSKQWMDYTGLPETEQLGLRWLESLHPDDRARAMAAWHAAVEEKAPYDVEFRIRRYDGAYRWFKARGVALRGRDGTIIKWFGTCTDIEDQRQALEERERLLTAERNARRQAEEASRAKDQFMAMLSHELRTPLTPVLATVSLLEQRDDVPETVSAELRVVRRNVELEARLIDDLLDLTRVTRGKLQLNLEAIDAHVAIRHAFSICCSDIQARQQHVSFELVAQRHFVRADAARLQQMFWNLLKNASKFTPDQGRITLRTRNLPATGNRPSRLRVEIADTGIGIEPAQLARLFEPFEQGGRDVTRQYGGLGLGLTITRAIAQVHGGEVSATSGGRGKGATFAIELPTVEAPAAARMPANGAPRPMPPGAEGGQSGTQGAAKRRGLRVLLVEDHVDTARVMSRLIGSMGHQVAVAGAVGPAMELARQREFDLIVSDVGLPDGTGLDLLKQLRAQDLDVPAIAVTGFGMDEDVQKSMEAGFAAHLTKPVDMGKLERTIQTVTGGAATSP